MLAEWINAGLPYSSLFFFLKLWAVQQYGFHHVTMDPIVEKVKV